MVVDTTLTRHLKILISIEPIYINIGPGPFVDFESPFN